MRRGALRCRGDYGLTRFDGQLEIASVHRLEMDSGGLHLYGTMTMDGARYQAPQLVHRGHLTTAAGAVLDAAVTFQRSSTTRLEGDLRLDGPTIVEDGATFGGSGSLIINPGASLAAAGTVGVDLSNLGLLCRGTSAGVLEIDGLFY